MNKFDELKREFLKQYPSYKTLPFLKRVRVCLGWYGHKFETHTYETENATYCQGATLVNVDGKYYLRYFGIKR